MKMINRDNEILVSARGLKKVYQTGKVEAQALRGVDLEVLSGEFLAIVGPSGSGKTTLLNLVGALDTATGGRLTVLRNDLATMTRRQRADMRLHSLGFVFQAYNLVPVLTAQENVEFVLELQGEG
ncbi:MAG: ATP-binding cassette domain-containing protein, partial [Sedimentisphaerales bacterium]|nr:ATP-binding cassette domain-containing protein [Sedimentisphaerales bacterium]